MGYAVVSADRRTENILAISTKGNINPYSNESNPGLDIFFANMESVYEHQIELSEKMEAELLNKALLKLTKSNKEKTRSATNYSIIGDWEQYNAVYPIIRAKWGQGSPYNDNAPIVNGSRAYAG